MLTKDDLETLEAILDRSSLSAILHALADIAGEKADHLRLNWGDEQSAKLWDKDAKRLDNLTIKLEC